MIVLKYKRLHIPSGSIDTEEKKFDALTVREAELALLLMLNKYNAQGGKMWKYWIERPTLQTYLVATD